MKNLICPKCGEVKAKDFIFKVLCPNNQCINYDVKLAKEEEDEKISKSLNYIDMKYNPLVEGDDSFWIPQKSGSTVKIIPIAPNWDNLELLPEAD